MPAPTPIPHSPAPGCTSCGASARLIGGLCPVCYAARRHDRLRFAGHRAAILEKSGRRCQACGRSGEGKREIHVHHRRPGVSQEKLLVALCPACHARIHKLQALDRILPPFARTLWRELHPTAAEQLALPLGMGLDMVLPQDRLSVDDQGCAAGARPITESVFWLGPGSQADRWESGRAG